MAAASLLLAAQQCYAHMFVYWTAGTLDARFAAFNVDLIAVFPSQQGDNTPGERTTSNWIVIGRALENQGALITAAQFNAAAEYVYRLCLAAQNANGATPKRISNVQAAAILAAYNAHLD